MIPINFFDDAIEFFASCPPVYTLPGTWTKCNAIIPHYNADPNVTFGISVLVIVILLSVILVFYKGIFLLNRRI